MTALKELCGVVSVYLFRSQSCYLKIGAANSLNDWICGDIVGSVVSLRTRFCQEQAAAAQQQPDVVKETSELCVTNR